MKVFLGIFSILLTLTIGTLAVLAIWDIYPISWTIIGKAVGSLILSSVVLSVAWLLVVSFLKKEKHKEDGNNTHRMN